MKGINTPGQALDSGGVASFSTPRDGVSHLVFPALAPERRLGCTTIKPKLCLL
ncbi:hypothetical protein [Sphaerochaeta halotolerans]|uniref:hypothetical protein n=1 Tax=Sphaerochaeta halotolerans TaxID=2293840 RepID=UPI001371DE3D|nr:hypothetical protein [Sphaerochaeta halotolerans]MXI85750.1 hypothetical protein [Sphaerochaeta halotolerans]